MSLTILVVDDEENARLNISDLLSQSGYDTQGAATLAEARKYVNTGSADIILLDVRLPDGYGPVLLEETAYLPMRPPIIVITAFGDIEMAVDVMKNGAIDFLQKPIQLDRLLQSIERAGEIVNMRRELAHLRNSRQREIDEMVATSPAMQRLAQQAERAAQVAVSVLITGETGTGKEVLARAIHKMGPRAGKPFIGENCAAIQPTVLESELFGYEPGAFTGADKRKPGLLETADGGLLFLDEISAMPIDIQAKLLRVLQERSFRRVGGIKELKVDIQVLAASNRNLMKMLEDGSFREDLYYRLSVVNLRLPPLRERKEEIPALVGLFIRQLNQQMGLNIQDITPKAIEALMAYDWPGNIRELRNTIELAMLFCDDPVIDLPHIKDEIKRFSA